MQIPSSWEEVGEAPPWAFMFFPVVIYCCHVPSMTAWMSVEPEHDFTSAPGTVGLLECPLQQTDCHTQLGRWDLGGL